MAISPIMVDTRDRCSKVDLKTPKPPSSEPQHLQTPCFFTGRLQQPYTGASPYVGDIRTQLQWRFGQSTALLDAVDPFQRGAAFGLPDP